MIKVGDIVKCIDIYNIYCNLIHITKNKCYKVTGNYHDQDIGIINDGGYEAYYDIDRFKVVTREKKLKRILK